MSNQTKKPVGKKPSVYVEFQGNKYTIKQLAHFSKVNEGTIRSRIRAGYQPDEFLRPAGKLHIATDKVTTK